MHLIWLESALAWQVSIARQTLTQSKKHFKAGCKMTRQEPAATLKLLFHSTRFHASGRSHARHDKLSCAAQIEVLVYNDSVVALACGTGGPCTGCVLVIGTGKPQPP